MQTVQGEPPSQQRNIGLSVLYSTGSPKINTKEQIKMTYEQYYNAVSEIPSYTDPDAYASDVALSDIFAGTPDDQLPALFNDLRKLWDVWHMPLVDMRKITGLSQAKFARRILSSQRTIEDWESGDRTPPIMTRFLIAGMLGLLPEITID